MYWDEMTESKELWRNLEVGKDGDVMEESGQWRRWRCGHREDNIRGRDKDLGLL